MREELWQCVGRIKGSEIWSHVSLGLQPFFGERGIMEYMMEKMAEKHPEAEFTLVPV